MTNELGRGVRPDHNPYPALQTLYSLVAIYALVNGVQGVLTLDVVSGPGWAFVWPILLVCATGMAIAGTAYSQRTRKHGWELVSIIGMFALMSSFSIAIFLRYLADERYNGLPIALLPLAVMVMPLDRLVAVARGTATR